MTFSAYHIQHIQLDDDRDLYLHWQYESRLYLVFWWKCIPLGDLYLNNSEGLDGVKLRQRIIKQIRPAIEMYTLGRGISLTDFFSGFLSGDHERFSQHMDEILSRFIPRITPPSVDVSVIICTRNRSSHLKKCLESLSNQRCQPVEIIIVDNAPEDDSTYQVAKNNHLVKYVREPRPGLDIARNTGARTASASIVAYTDDDVELNPWWTFQVSETFTKADTSAMTGLVIASELKTQSQQLFEKYWSFNRGYIDKVFDSFFFKKHLAEGPPVWEIGAGANMAFKKEIFEKVGYFDERLDVGAAGCNGDSEMWYRILLNGGSIHYNPRAVVLHEHRKDIHSLKKQIYNYMRGFTAAALIQQKLNHQAGYKKHLFLSLPYHYIKLIMRGFPKYRGRYTTLFNEIRGVFSGIGYYQKNKSKNRF